MVEAVTQLGAELPILHLPWSKVLHPSKISQDVSFSPIGARGPFSYENLHALKCFLFSLCLQVHIQNTLSSVTPHPFFSDKVVCHQREQMQNPARFLLVLILDHRACAEATMTVLWKGAGAKEGKRETQLQVQVAQSKAHSGPVGSKHSTEQRSRLRSWVS